MKIIFILIIFLYNKKTNRVKLFTPIIFLFFIMFLHLADAALVYISWRSRVEYFFGFLSTKSSTFAFLRNCL